jgi:hypothetical protein
MKGYCRNDADCPFAHGVPDLHGMLIAPTLPAPTLSACLPPLAPPSLAPPTPTPQRAPPPAPVRPNYGQAGQFLLSIFRNLEQVFPE